MTLLQSLEREFPIIDANFQQFCASHNIFSVEDFLVHDLYVLVAFAEHHATSKELKQGITRVLSIVDSQHQPWLNGVELLEDAKLNKHVLSTGCEGIDVLLQGGLHEGRLTELVGPSSSGKTQVNGRTLAGVMSNILCHPVFDVFTLLDVLHQLEFELRAQVKNEDTRMRLLIVDSISSLITPVLGGKGSNGRSLMISVGFLLKKLANEHNISVLVTNHMVGGEGGNTKPALGETWKTVPHVRLLLSRDHRSNIYNVSVLKHTCMASGQVGRFIIQD
ncbi:DNA repair protein RAD51 homolog 4 isoform X2 [Magnolia sinica]|uniref:DNA repair protein RAD51 homolog 4 isoform X2 n=1 Tax=Magnolia sinica TaxID=86752 RepID=UPI00265A3527|nr:DNA repair protein RAD51 homolog 4 isoform X2 [Magnolia sinica]